MEHDLSDMTLQDLKDLHVDTEHCISFLKRGRASGMYDNTYADHRIQYETELLDRLNAELEQRRPLNRLKRFLLHLTSQLG